VLKDQLELINPVDITILNDVVETLKPVCLHNVQLLMSLYSLLPALSADQLEEEAALLHKNSAYQLLLEVIQSSSGSSLSRKAVEPTSTMDKMHIDESVDSEDDGEPLNILLYSKINRHCRSAWPHQSQSKLKNSSVETDVQTALELLRDITHPNDNLAILSSLSTEQVWFCVAFYFEEYIYIYIMHIRCHWFAKNLMWSIWNSMNKPRFVVTYSPFLPIYPFTKRLSIFQPFSFHRYIPILNNCAYSKITSLSTSLPRNLVQLLLDCQDQHGRAIMQSIVVPLFLHDDFSNFVTCSDYI
jgi:hypothetical protein